MSAALDLADETATEALGARLAESIVDGGVLHLRGGLGAGKTTLCRGLLRALGHTGAVKSPTYTLVEPYTTGGRQIFHFDLYRLRDPQELEDIGIRDYLQPRAILLIEWPELGGPCTPPPDLVLALRETPAGRSASWEPLTRRGEVIVAQLEASLRRA